MTQINITLKTDASTSFVKNIANLVNNNWGASVGGLKKLVQGLLNQTIPLTADSDNISVNVQLGGVQASAVGTFTGQPTANDTITLGLQAITCKNSGAGNNEFNKGSSTQETCQNLVNAINNSTTANVSKNVVASYEDLSTAKATGTIQFTGQPSNNDTCVVNGITFTAKTSGATGNQFNIGSTVTETVDNFILALQNNTTLRPLMSFVRGDDPATAATAVLTMTGNPSNNDTLTINGSVLTAKTSGATGDQYNITSGNPTTTAASLVTAFNASTNFNTLFSAAAGANAGNKAFGTLTLAGGDIVANETFTVNGVVFTAKASGATGNQFNIAAGNLATTCTNIITAWNASVTAGATVITASQGAGTSVKFEYDTAGSVGNAITTVEALTNASFGGATMASGTDSIPITFTVLVAGSAGNAYACSESMGNATISGSNFSGGADDIDIDITANQAGTIGNGYTLTESMSNCTVSGATLSGGVDNVTLTVKSRIGGLIGNYYPVTESMNNFTITGSGKLTGGTATDYYNLSPTE